MKMTTVFAFKLETFRLAVESQQIARYREQYGQHPMTEQAQQNEQHATKTVVSVGRKYVNVDIGTRGAYMVEISTGNIFGIKAYGQPHKGHFYGTLETIGEYFWGDYYPSKRDGSLGVQKANGCPAMTYVPETVTLSPEQLEQAVAVID